MADELKVKIQAELDTSNIKANLPDVEKDLAKSDKGRINLVGQLDVSATKTLIEAQLQNLKLNMPTLNFGLTTKVDDNSFAEQMARLEKNADVVFKNIKSKFNLSGEFADRKNAVAEYSEALNTGNFDKAVHSLTYIKDCVTNLSNTMPQTQD